MRITSTPANGTHYVAGEAITTRLDLPAHLHSGNPATSWMKLDIGPRQRRAASTTPYSFALAGVNYSYTVVADDVDTDGIAIPANAIVVSGQPWRTAGSAFINLNNAALSSQAAHKVIGSTAYISATNPSPLTEASLNGATVTIALDGLTYGSGVTDSDFLLATTVQNLSIASLGSVSSGDTAATLTLAFTGDTGFELDGTLAATIAGSAHSGTSFLSTGSVPVLATDTAPSFGSGSVTDKSYRPGMAITEFQVPAATGGNGALTYSASNLPTGLVFDADGTGACPGTEPREICGTPTAASGAHTVTITATDEDTNTAASDAATLRFQIAVTGATLASTPTPLTEANLNGARLTVALLDGATFTGVSAASFELVTAPAIPGLSIGGVAGGASGSSSATLTLATGAGYGFSTQATIAVRALAAAHSGTSDVVSDALAVSPAPGVTVSKSRLALDEAPGASNANRGTYTVVLDSAPTGCFAVAVQATSDNSDVTVSPTGRSFNNNSGSPQFWSRPQTFTVTAAHDADYTDDTATISHSISVACAAAGYATSLAIDSLTVTVDDDEDPTASISSTSPAALTEANLHSAQITVALAYATFGSGVTTASFELVTDIPSASVALVSNVSSGDTTATLTLAFTGGFSAVETLAVKVKAAAHTGGADLTTGTVAVTPTPGIALSRTSLALEEDPTAGGATNANVGAYTVALTANPRTAAGGSCAVFIEAVSNNAGLIIDTGSTPQTKRLVFDQSDWNTPQTITVRAASDADGVDVAATISHSRVASLCVGDFFGRPSLPSLTVAVNDDETPTAAIASPSILTAATLNGATVTVSLSLTTFASGVGASSFELVTGAAGVSIASATATAGGTSATLTLSHTGTLAADAKLAVKVLAAAHAGDADLTTGQIDVLVAADTAPSFGSATVGTKYFAEGEAIAPFQLPAATGGNGALSYAIAAGNRFGLPAGLKFDATGTDAGGCAAGDFPPGTAASWATAPRTICGTLTRPGSVDSFNILYEAHDADSNRADSDRASLIAGIDLARAEITSTSPATLAEGNLNSATVSVRLFNATFASGVAAASFDLVTAIPSLSVSQVSGVTTGGATATLTLAFTGDFSASQTLAVKVKAAAHSRAFDLTTGALTINPQVPADTAPSFSAATLPTKYFAEGVAIAPFQLPAASGGNGALSYAIAAGNVFGLPAGLKFDASGADAGGCGAGDFPPGTAASWATAPRTICGTLTRPGSVDSFNILYEAHDADSNRADSDRASLIAGIDLARAEITSTSPAVLAEGNLNNATASLRLFNATFASGVTAASFELVTAIPNVSVSQVSGVTTGGATATLTLAFTGDFSASETLAVKVKAAAHNRAFDLTTGALTINPQGLVDTAPSFGSATVSSKVFAEGVAIAPFQLPAASGGNGALSYAIAAGNVFGLPAGLKFDATGADAGGCAAGDFPPGTAASWATAPRTVCGTLTRPGSVDSFNILYEAHDADSNRADSDRASLIVGIDLARAEITSTSPATLAEGNLNSATASVRLFNATFASGVTATSFELVTAIPNVSVSQVSGVTTGGTTATLTLAFTGDFSASETLAVKVKAAAHNRAFDLTTGAVTVAPTDTEPAFPAVAAKGFPTNVAIAPFQIPAATGGNGAVSYAVAGLPDGLKFDLTGTDAGGCTTSDFPSGTDASWATAPRTVCGTPTRDVTSVVVVTATDEDGDVARLTLRVTVAAPAAVLGDTVPAALSEANLHGATLIVALARTAFAGGVSASSFELVTAIPGLSVSSVSAVSAGDTQATLTLAFTGDFGGTRDLAVKVLAAAHTGSADLTTGTAPVTASPGVTLSRDSLALNEAPGTNNANRGTYTVALAAVPTGCTGGVGVAVASDNADVAVSPSTLTFTTANWSAPQTVTVTAAQDDMDSNDDVATLSHSISTACAGGGYPAGLAIGSVTVTVADDEVGAAIVPTPATLTEANLHGATLALSLTNAAFSAGAPAAGAGAFELVSAIPNLSVSQASGVTAGGATATLTLAFTGDFRGQPTLAVRVPAASHQGAGALTSNAVTVTANPGVTVSKTSLSLDEHPGTTNANRGTYTVAPDSPPTGCAGGVGVAVASSNADVAVSPSALTFTASNWNAAQTVTVTAAQDDDGADDAAILSHSVSTACAGAGYPAGLAIGSLSVAVDDDETPAVVIDADPSTTNMDEAGPLELTEGHASNAAKTYSVRLATEPTQTVTVTLTSADTGAVSIDDTDGDSGNGVQNTLTFTAMNWSTAQTVTARAADDDNATDESVALAHAAGTATTSEYTGVTASLTATVDDDETRAVTLSASTLSVPENGSATYTVKLAAQPVGGDVTVTITGAGSGITASPTTLTFTATNWSAAQTVTVSAAEDANTANESVTLTHTPTGADYGGGAGMAAEIVATAAENDTPSLRVDPTMLTVEEGSSASYQVRLNTQPSAGVTVTVAGATAEVTVDTDDDATGNQTTLTFSTTDWGTNQEVKVSAAEDDDGTDETLTLSHTATGATEYAGLAVGAARPSVAVTVDDNDMRAIVIDTDPTTASVVDPGPLALNEKQTDPANAKTYSVRLATEPTTTVTVTITSGDAGAVSIDDTDGDSTNGVQNTLTFTTTTWDTAQSVTVRAAEDDDGGNETLDLTHAASGGDYDDLSATLGAKVADDDPLGLVFAATDLTTNGLDEGGSATYTVKLATQPTGAVAVAIASDNADVTVDDTDGVTPGVQSSLAFDATTWNTAQTVRIRAVEDDDGADETIELTHDPSGADYDGVESADLEFTLNDDDPRGLTLSASTLSVPEAASATYTVKLDTQPVGGNATVTITGAGDGITASPTTLTFTRSNWSAAQTVTVRAANDQNTANEVVTLTHTPTGADYGGVTPAALAATATDDDTPSLRVSPTVLTVAEGGSAAYKVRLNTQPSAGVTVTVGGATGAVTVDTDGDTTGNQTTLTFSTTDWDTDQEVTVSAAEDDDATNEMLTLGHTAMGATEYTGLAIGARPGVTVTVDDDDTPAILIDADPTTMTVDETGPLALNELSTDPANSKSYTVRLATEPTTAVTVEVESGDRAVSVDTDMTPRTRTLAFTTTNWSSPRTVTATAAEDNDASDERVTIEHSAAGGDYQGVEASLVATTVDDDEPKLAVDASALTAAGLAEGASGTYTVRLATEPTGPVRVAVSVSGGVSVDADGDQAGNQGSLRFDGADWSVPKAVRVRALRDDDATAGTAVLGHSASGSDYGGVSAPAFSFEVRDGDAPALAVSASSLAVNEGSSAAYSVALATRPVGGPVTVSLSSSDAAAATVSPSSLTFTAGNWDRPRTVTVLGVADGSATVAHAASGADYDSVAASVSVAVRDSGAAGVRVEPPQLTVREGGSGSYRVRLNTQPTATTTVTATATSAALAIDDDGTPQSRTLTFTTEDWGVGQAVTVSAGEDDGSEDGAFTVTHAVSGYAGVSSAPALAVAVEDDDAPGFAFDPAGGLSLSEPAPGVDPAASSRSYSVRLATQPTATTTVAVTSDDAGVEVDGAPRTLTFDGSSWDAPQTVTVRAVPDADAVSETASLRHAASGGGYGGVSASLPVRVLDATAPPPDPEPPPPPPVNQPPRAVGSLPDLRLDVGESASLRLGGLFADDGPLTHRAESSAPSVASARVEGNAALRVEGLSLGLATVTVTATDRGGLSARLSLRASVGRVLSFAAPSASAPEGGVLRLALALSRPASAALSVAWAARPDGDPATADADAADLGAMSGTAAFAAGGTEALVEIPVPDDADIEPAREFLTVELAPPPEGAGWALGLSEALLEVREGVCDRSPAVRDALVRDPLRGPLACWAPTPAELAGRGYLSLHRKGIAALRPLDLLGLSGLRVLHLHGNHRLAALPEGLFAGLGALERLRLDGNRLAELPAGLLAGAPRLSLLDLGGNRIESLPAGLFAGVAGLAELNLSGNPGAPFPLVVRLARTDAEPWAPGPARVEARVAEGAPFALSAALLAQGAELSATQASVPAGATAGPPLQAAQAGPWAARLSLAADPAVPEGVCGDVQDGLYPCFRGLAPRAGPPLVLFKPPPRPTERPPAPALSADGDRASLPLDGLIGPAGAGDRLAYAARTDRPDLLAVRVADGRLVLEANEDGLEGTAVVTVTATDPDGPSASLTLTVTVEFARTGAAPSWRLEWMRTLREADGA